MFGKKAQEKLARRMQRSNEFMLREISDGLDSIRSAQDIPLELYDGFWRARESLEYQAAFTESEPLVSICTATFNRPDILLERTLPSVLNQSYKNIEYIVVGDGVDEQVYKSLLEIDDPRFHFVNLPERGQYPLNPELRWMVAGGVPLNKALELSRGQFVTHLDDDDAYASDRIEKLVNFAQSQKLDFIWHPFYTETESGDWQVNEAQHFTHGQVTNSGVFYHQWLNTLPFDLQSYRYREPGDWNRFRKFKHLGVNAARFPEALLYHYREGSQKASSNTF
jgi:hypothetical protein